MTWRAGLVAAAATLGAVLAPAVAYADTPAPELGSPCSDETVDAMTLLPDETTYARCQQQVGAGNTWQAVQTPFDPNDSWFSYGPAITLHGQGMRNPNLSSGRWTATPLDPETTCIATQTTVVEAGVLAEPQTTEGAKGQPLALEMLPRLFYAELAGDCLWARD